MRHRIGLLLCLVTLDLTGVSSRAAAEPYPDHDDAGEVRLYEGVVLGSGGTADVRIKTSSGTIFNESDDLATSVGGQVGLDVPVQRFLSLGAEVRLLSCITRQLADYHADRDKLLDIGFKPRLRFSLRNAPFEFYLTVPVGFTVPFLHDQSFDTKVAAKTGWNIGAGAGVNWWLVHNFGLNWEPLFLFHKFNIYGPAEQNSSTSLRQFTMFINAVVTL
ncbi:MAG: hypothetical protein JWN04_322 [Myxococcaceae bacterium]|nr:hypothetical protein [Myxococcaceae bacterium]